MRPGPFISSGSPSAVSVLLSIKNTFQCCRMAVMRCLFLEEVGAGPYLHKDKAELAHVGGQSVCRDTATTMFSQVGGTRVVRRSEARLCSP